MQRLALVAVLCCTTLPSTWSEQTAPGNTAAGGGGGGAAPWRWACREGRCSKVQLRSGDLKTALSLAACKMFCADFGTLWPQPSGAVSLGTKLIRINIDAISTVVTNRGKSDPLTDAAIQRFKEKIKIIAPPGRSPKLIGKSVTIYLVNRHPDVTVLQLGTDEGYELTTQPAPDGSLNATVAADTFFGARHGLETLLQLLIYDDIRNEIQAVKNARVVDRPAHPYRGFLLDTARNYYSVDSIKRTIDAMAMVKLNTFHWHITDSHSFPFVSKSRPELSEYGALSPDKVYTVEMIRELVEFARARGVRVLPELDAPAHVGEGWQSTNMTVCFGAEPWRQFCVEPPCGQLDPSNPGLYDILQDIYTDMLEAFTPDMFHMGGDEVSESCWNSSQRIQDFIQQNRWDLEQSSFLKLWEFFQVKARDRVIKANNNTSLPIVLWTSTLTDYSVVDKYLNKDDYIIQVWTTGNSPQISGLLQKGYRLIMSNYDALYFDCGFGAWVGSGNNWCSPYIGWQKVYDNSPVAIAAQHKNLILGGEAALWSEQSDSASLDTRAWPRLAAAAERLWSEPATDWRAAEQRMLHIRERLVRAGVQADAIEPEWCYQNEGKCYA